MMNFMNSVKMENKYFWKSRQKYLVILGAIFVTITSSFQIISDFQNTKLLYKNTVGQVNKADLLKQLSESYHITSSGGGQIINNSTHFAYDQMYYAVQQTNPIGFIRYIFLAAGMPILPIVSGLLAIMIASYDYSNDTYRRKLSNFTSSEVILGKYPILLASITLFYSLLILFGIVASLIVKRYVGYFTFSVSKFPAAINISDLFSALGLSLAIGIIVGLIWYNIAIIIKNTAILTVAFLIIQLVIPQPWKFSYINSVKNLYGSIINKTTYLTPNFTRIPVEVSIGIILSILVVSLIGGYIYFTRFVKYHLK